MNAPSKDIADMLEAESALGFITGINMFQNFEPSKPDNCVTIFDTYGRATGLTLGVELQDKPSIQIRVRAQDSEVAWTMIDSIRQLLDGRSNETWGGCFYMLIYCASGPGLLDHDENSRARYIVNFNLQRR